MKAQDFLKRKVYNTNYLHKKVERSQINNLMMHHKVLEKQNQIKSKSGGYEEIVKMWAENNKIRMKNDKTPNNTEN